MAFIAFIALGAASTATFFFFIAFFIDFIAFGAFMDFFMAFIASMALGAGSAAFFGPRGLAAATPSSAIPSPSPEKLEMRRLVARNLATLQSETHFKRFMMKFVALNLPHEKIRDLAEVFEQSRLVRRLDVLHSKLQRPP